MEAEHKSNSNQQEFPHTSNDRHLLPNTPEVLQPNNEELLRQVNKLESELTKAHKNLSTRMEEEATTNAKLKRQRELLTRAGHQIQENNENIKKKNQDITLLNEEVTSLKHQLKHLDSEKTAALQRLTLEEQRAYDLNSEIEKIKIKFLSEVSSMADARVREEVNKALLSMQKSYHDKQCEYEEKIKNLEKSHIALEKEFSSYRIRAQSLVQAAEILPSEVQPPGTVSLPVVHAEERNLRNDTGVMVSFPVVHGEERNIRNDTGVMASFPVVHGEERNVRNDTGTMVSFPVVHGEERNVWNDTEVMVSFPVVHGEERNVRNDTGVMVSFPVVHGEERNVRNDTGEVIPARQEVVSTEELEQTRCGELGLFQDARVRSRAEEGVLHQKVTALEAQIVHLQKELQDRVSQEEIRRIQRLLEKQKKKTETHQNEIKQLSEKYEEEKRKLAEYKQYASSLLHEKQNEISNLKDTIEVMEQNISGTKISLLPTTTSSPLEEKEETKKLNLKIQLLKNELEESKKMSELLFLQQDVLKEEIRHLERTQKRDGNFNSEYLKNVLLKYMQTGHQEGLVPVIAEMLQFSPVELASVTKGQTGTGTVKVGGFWQGLF